ncbi:MAG: hypothetical protein K2M73_08445 [Lachnospiraceae bacterium]|nr:hypothetical protein [Lachnospiraceae bacterium]
MGALEIFLIIFGIIIIIVSFVFGEHLAAMDNNPEYDTNIAGVTKEIVKKEVEAEVANVIDEKIEQAEIKLDKITNEKIMALGDYSEDVNVKITKNHDEVMFLYDMLSDKEKTIKNTVKDVESLKVSVKQMAVANDFAKQSIEKKSEVSKTKTKDLSKSGKKNVTSDNKKELNSNQETKTDSEDSKVSTASEDLKSKSNVSEEVLDEKGKDNKSKVEPEKIQNNNKEILDLYNQGKTNIEIAKQLGLGMGEVKLVIDLFKTRK